MEDKIRVLLSEEEVDKRIEELGRQISRDYEGRSVHLICVLKGGVFLPVSWQRESRFLYLWTLCR